MMVFSAAAAAALLSLFCCHIHSRETAAVACHGCSVGSAAAVACLLLLCWDGNTYLLLSCSLLTLSLPK